MPADGLAIAECGVTVVRSGFRPFEEPDGSADGPELLPLAGAAALVQT
jgi:hypothetical protein